ncbi:MAG TPA: hypothetical protein VHG28_08810 [Longimicrobiaceae bacterium]|nr:hypothetical protein [Longimicrobiaceae bacterium]
MATARFAPFRGSCLVGEAVLFHLELFSPSYVNVCYWALANQVDLEYFYLVREDGGPAGAASRRPSGDIYVNPERLAALLARAELS